MPLPRPDDSDTWWEQKCSHELLDFGFSMRDKSFVTQVIPPRQLFNSKTWLFYQNSFPLMFKNNPNGVRPSLRTDWPMSWPEDLTANRRAFSWGWNSSAKDHWIRWLARKHATVEWKEETWYAKMVRNKKMFLWLIKDTHLKSAITNVFIVRNEESLMILMSEVPDHR